MLMKKVQIVIPLVLVLIVGSTAITPAVATKEKGEKIEYTMAGTIWDSDKGTYGTISLSFSGKTTGPPDYEYEESGSGQEYTYDGYWEEEWQDEDGYWRANVYLHYEIIWVGSWSVYEARWYSRQPTFNGKIVVIWEDGSTETFRADLSPTVIDLDRSSFSGEGELFSELGREIYLWNTDTNEWQRESDRDEIYTESFTWSGSSTESVLSIDFSGKIQTRGRPPLKGFLDLYEYRQVVDGNEYGWASVSGEFGPYSLSGGAVPVPPPVR